jgi:hypothetical protein
MQNLRRTINEPALNEMLGDPLVLSFIEKSGSTVDGVRGICDEVIQSRRNVKSIGH